jgi:hypothetical protein
MRPQRAVGLLVAVGLLSACASIRGSGDIISEAREVGSFTRVDASEGVRVQLVVDPAAESAVTVRYDDNVLGKVITRVDGGTLEVRIDGTVALGGGGDRYVEIVVPGLTGVGADSGASVTGSGSLAGLEVNGSGGASVDLGGLEAERIDIMVSGGARVTIRASDAVEGEASGGARLTVLGDPGRVDVATSGGASVSSS